MTSGQKTAFSLLATMILYTAFVLVANTRLKLFDNLEKQYYSQAKVKEKVEQLDTVTESYDSYITNVLKIIDENDDSYLKSEAVLSYLDYNPSEKLIEQRRIKTAQLFYDLPGLDGLRIVDTEGRFIQYSSYENTDLTNKDAIKKVYDRYPSIVDKYDELAFSLISPGEKDPVRKISLDSGKQRIIISFPIYRFENYAGVLLAYFDFNQIQKELENSDLSKTSFVLISDKNLYGGILTGMPKNQTDVFLEPVENYWKNRSLDSEKKLNLPEKIVKIDDGRYYEILSSTDEKYINVSGVYTNDIFELSDDIKLLIYIAVGITLFLLIFLIFSFKGDGVVTLKKRIRRIQYGIINEYLTNKEEIEWDKVINQIKQRQTELSKEILKAAHVSKRKEKELDEVLSKSWEEIFSVIEPKVEAKKIEVQQSNGVSKEELRQMLEEVLKETKLNVNVANVAAVTQKASKPAAVKPAAAKLVEKVEEPEELTDELEEVEELAEPVEDIEEVEELDEPEELTEPADELEEVEELAEPVEDIEEVEELDEPEELTEPADELEEVEELAEPVEDIEKVEELDEPEELTEPADELEEVEELAEPVEDIEEVEELDEPEELTEPVDELEEVEELAEPVEDIEEVEELDEPEELTEPADELEEVEELAEPVEDIEEVQELDEPEELTEPADEPEEVEELAEPAEELDEAVEELAEPVEELEELEELSEAVDDVENSELSEEELIKKDIDDTLKLIKALSGSVQYEYKDSNDTFINLNSREEFATVDSAFAEELCLGEQYSPENTDSQMLPDFEVYPYLEETKAAENIEEIEEITDEDMFISKDYFSMTQFGANTNGITELEGLNANSIVENEGVYQISENLQYTDVILDPDFKSLVDSVLK